MMNALNSAATGMLAQQTSMDVVANNLSNASTVGYRRDRADLVDLDYTPFQLVGGREGRIGLGAAPGGISKEHQGGRIEDTGRPLDVAVEGDGFFQITRADGTLAYTRAGNFQADANGRLTLPTGELLEPRVTIPAGASNTTIAPDGTVSADVGGTIRNLGQIRTATFTNPGGLQAVGGTAFVPTENSGAAQVGAPGTGGRGTVRQGGLESSNVDVAVEMVQMITTQRAFEASSRVVTAADQMMGMANGLRQ
jgi:flagellar basal-body rod protein FlgG